ncbi:Thiol-disulfide isomerase or thioredoxin [Halogeometricum rufum]|uniref:Thiol-disulfide isomerase or thioredoxin n=1 Tax=Halogeometricum rufum TaxID=553469 RepID=A0A1I6IZ52_9EURY|nr:thioredoxin family protein [Halogeometricum rufum]SFR71520.1 Thiol-disulfide isomerase or thioredoxin [Halogeometricum rufum]
MADAESGTLDTMQPNPAWDAASYEDAVDALAEDGLVFKVWGGDWCKDCRTQLPDFAAALRAAEVPEENVEHYPVEKADDGSKVGPLVEEYDVERIPTVVVEREGKEVARFVEEERVSVAVYLARRLSE